MRDLLFISLLVIMSLTIPCARAQTGNDPDQSAGNADVQSNQSGAAPAMGQEPNPPQASQFPPLSGLDEPSLEPNVAARSFLLFGAQASQLVDSNAANNLGRKGTPLAGVTHALGSAALQRLWERYQVGIGYVGGAALYAGNVRQNGQLQELNFDARTLWRTGAFTIRDSASYLPDGSFGGSFGEAGALGTLGAFAGGGLGGANGGRFSFFGANTFGALGDVPRFQNLAAADLQQQLSPRSAFTLAAGYNLIHFTRSTGGLLIDSRQSTAQAGYNYSINRRNQIAFIYGFQHFQFPVLGASTFVTHVVQVLYSHQITGRMYLLLGAGPQFTHFSSATVGNTLKLSATGRASLRYRFPRASLMMSYARFDSAAAGFFAGASTDLAQFSVERPLARRWLANVHAGYTHNKRLQVAALGVNAGSFQAGFAGMRLSHPFTRSLQGFVFYDFNDLALSRDFCGVGRSCNRTSIRHMAGIGLSWHPRAIRLD